MAGDLLDRRSVADGIGFPALFQLLFTLMLGDGPLALPDPWRSARGRCGFLALAPSRRRNRDRQPARVRKAKVFG